MKIIIYFGFRFCSEMPVAQYNPKVVGRIFVQFPLIFLYKLGEKHENSERGRKT